MLSNFPVGALVICCIAAVVSFAVFGAGVLVTPPRHPRAKVAEGTGVDTGFQQPGTLSHSIGFPDVVPTTVTAGAHATLGPPHTGWQGTIVERCSDTDVACHVGKNMGRRRRGNPSHSDSNLEQDFEVERRREAPCVTAGKTASSMACGHEELHTVPCAQGRDWDRARIRSGHGRGSILSSSQPPLVEDYINSPDRPLLVWWRPRLLAQGGTRGNVPRQLRCNVVEPFRFESELFEGRAVLWVKGLPSSPPDLFRSLKRTSCLIIQVRRSPDTAVFDDGVRILTCGNTRILLLIMVCAFSRFCTLRACVCVVERGKGEREGGRHVCMRACMCEPRPLSLSHAGFHTFP